MSGIDDRTDEPVPPFRNEEWIREPLADMKRREAQEMPGWFIPGLAATFAWMGLFIWLAAKVNWPEAYGFRGACVHRGCLTEAIIRSPVLLQHPTALSVALFAWFAVTGAAIAGTVLYFVALKPTTRSLLMLAVIVILVAVLALQPISEWDL
jgi:FtsH-binding integral membrane protein